MVTNYFELQLGNVPVLHLIIECAVGPSASFNERITEPTLVVP